MVLKQCVVAALLAALSGAPLAAAAESAQAPRVVATIGPLHSLAAAVMAGVATPELLIPGGASPHAYSLRPSEAAALEQADLVVWVGPALERFLEDGLASLAPRAQRLEVLDLPGVALRYPREGGAWEAHEHEHEHEHEQGHEQGHAAGESQEQEAEAGHEDHDDDHDHDHDHGHGHGEESVDPHVWLDPANAEVVVTALARTLSEIDPAHGEAYRANAARTRDRLAALTAELKADLAPVAGKPFIVFHDAYGYFEQAFGLSAVGSVTISPEQQPSARRVAELRDKIRGLGAVCLFREPQFAPRLVETLAEGTKARIGVLDPLGADLAPGPEAYPALLRHLGGSLSACLGGTS